MQQVVLCMCVCVCVWVYKIRMSGEKWIDVIQQGVCVWEVGGEGTVMLEWKLQQR